MFIPNSGPVVVGWDHYYKYLPIKEERIAQYKKLIASILLVAVEDASKDDIVAIEWLLSWHATGIAIYLGISKDVWVRKWKGELDRLLSLPLVSRYRFSSKQKESLIMFGNGAKADEVVEQLKISKDRITYWKSNVYGYRYVYNVAIGDPNAEETNPQKNRARA